MGLCVILFFFNIHVIPLTDGDSAFYAKIAKNIVESGNWLTMHYGDASTIINKPPLMMWLTAASFKIFGVNDFAVCFWHSLFALLTVFFTYKLAKLLFDCGTAFISGLVLATSAQFFYMARSPLQDIPLTLFILLAVYCFALFEKTRKLPYFYLSPVFAALAVLSKGPVGVVIIAIILLIHLIVNRPKLPSLTHMILAVILFFAIALPWFVAEYRVLGRAFIDVQIGSNLGRYFGPIDTVGSEAVKYQPIRPQYDFYSFFLQILILMIPWSGYIYPAIYYSFKKRTNLLPAIFALSVLIFFSLSLNYKISRYILPAFPALSIMIGSLISDSEKDRTAAKLSVISSWITLVLIVPFLALATWLLYINSSESAVYYLPILLSFEFFLFLGLISGSILGIINKFKYSFLSYLAFASISYLALVLALSLNFANIDPVSEYCARINAAAKPGDIICQYRGTDAHFMIYYSKFPVVLIRDREDLIKLLGSKKKVYCITEYRDTMKEINKAAAER